MSGPLPPDVSAIELRARRAAAGYVRREVPGVDVPFPPPGPGPLPPTVAAGAALLDERLPRRYRDAVPTRPETWAWLEAAPDGAGLLITGGTGTGKTHEAYGAVRAWAAAGLLAGPVLFGNVAQVLDRARPDGDLTVRGIAEVGLLLLDDLGAMKASEWTQEALYRIVDHRWAECLPTLATTNLATSSLGAAVGDRIADRLRAWTVVAMVGRSRRARG